jgi:hypothetical protein
MSRLRAVLGPACHFRVAAFRAAVQLTKVPSNALG